MRRIVAAVWALAECVAQAATSPQELIAQTHNPGRSAESEALVRKALALWDPAGSTETAEYANAQVLLALLTFSRANVSFEIVGLAGLLVEHAIEICGTQNCPGGCFSTGDGFTVPSLEGGR